MTAPPRDPVDVPQRVCELMLYATKGMSAEDKTDVRRCAESVWYDGYAYAVKAANAAPVPSAAQPAEPPATDATPFVYLINRMERAAQQDNPAAHEYAKHRAAVFEFVERQAREIAEARQLFNKEYNEHRESRRRLREELSGERDRHKRTAERAERAEAELHNANIDSANLLAECSDMSVDIEKYRGEIAALRMAVKDDAQWAQENERLTKERDELRTMLQTTNQANGRLAEVADKYKGQSRELDRVKVQLTSEITAALAERDALRECVKAADAIRKYLPVGHGTVRNPHLSYSQDCLRAWDYDAARAKVKP